MSFVISQLVEFIASQEEELRSIASLALKTLISAVPPQSNIARYSCTSLAPKLLNQVSDSSSAQELLIDSLDLLASIFQRFAAYTLESLQLQKQGLSTLTSTLTHGRPAVRKRAVAALSLLAANSASEVFTQLATSTSTALSGGDADQIKTYAQLVGALARSSPRRLGRRLPDFLPRLLEALQQDEDELRENVLQTLEQILLKCPAEITPFLNQTIEVSLELIKHDPNFAGADGDGDDEMVDAFDDEDDEDLGLDEDYSDDEDMSWKVRRAAVKTLAAAITTRQEMLTSFVTTVAPVLVSRFSEREESVRLEVLQSFLALLKQIRISNGRPQATEVQPQSPSALKRKRDLMELADSSSPTPRHQLAALVPQTSKALLKELGSKSLSTRLIATTVLRELAVVLDGGLESQVQTIIEQLGKIVPAAAEANAAGSASIKSEIISLLRVLFALHESRSYKKQLSLAVPILTSTIQDRAHRDALEALSTSSVLVRALARSSTDGQVPDLAAYQAYLTELFDAAAVRLDRPDSDQEMRESCIETISVLTSVAGDLLIDRLPQAFSLLEARLRNEITRLAAVRAISRIAPSKACTGQVLANFLDSVSSEVTSLIRQSNRALRLSAFEALAAIVRRLDTHLSPATAEGILKQATPMVTLEEDISAFPQVLQLLGLVAHSSAATFSTHADTIFSSVRQVLTSAILQATSMEAIVAFFGVVAAEDHALGTKSLTDLTSSLADNESVQTFANVARCVGAVVRSDRATIDGVIALASQAIKASPKDQAGRAAFGLHLLGEVGRIEDFSKHSELLNLVLQSSDSPIGEVKTAAAFALGNMAVGNLEAFLPVIRERIEGQDKHRYLALTALKEVITHGSAVQLANVAELLWIPLFDICQTEDQATRNIGSECLARLTLADPGKYLVHLQSRLNDPSALTRAAVIAAIRFTLTDSSPKYDELLAPALVEFLTLLQDPDLEVRRHALFALNSAAHNKPHLIRSQLTTLQPLLYGETQIRPELMRKVTMGPFTITQDDGLDLRKNAFETMYTLLDSCLDQISLPEYLGRVMSGLRDDDQVKLLCFLILVRLTDLVPTQISPAIEELSDPINESLKIKLKEGATKQEVEKSTELTRAAFRALVALAQLPSASTAPRFQQLLREARSGPSAGLFHEVAQSASRQQQQRA